MVDFIDKHRRKALAEVRRDLQRLVDLRILTDAMLLIRLPDGTPDRIEFANNQDSKKPPSAAA